MSELSTADYDPRFPNTNQTKHCWTNYVDYHVCMKKKGADAPSCQSFKAAYRSLCPTEWTEKWDEQIQNKRFPGQVLFGVSEKADAHH